MKQIWPLLLLLIVITSCNGQDQAPQLLSGSKDSVSESTTTPAGQPNINAFGTGSSNQMGKNIHCIFQDKTGNLWFASDGNGVCRYDGKSVTCFTEKEGLCSNRILTIVEDKTGNLWFGSDNGVCRYDGQSFTRFTNKDGLRNNNVGRPLEYKPGSLWFTNADGVLRYDGSSFTSFTIHPASYHVASNNLDRPYGVYSILEDKAGNLWFGTDQKGVCRYDGKSFTWFAEKGLSNHAVRSIFQDKTGNLWFGSNGGGVCRYDGKSLTNFSEEKGLSKNLVEARLEDETQKLNRVWSITEDNNGNIWFGTIDEGVWRYDGKSMTNFTTNNGLGSNAIWTVFKDKTGNLWFGTEGGGVYKYNGKSFTQF